MRAATCLIPFVCLQHSAFIDLTVGGWIRSCWERPSTGRVDGVLLGGGLKHVSVPGMCTCAALLAAPVAQFGKLCSAVCLSSVHTSLALPKHLEYGVVDGLGTVYCCVGRSRRRRV